MSLTDQPASHPLPVTPRDALMGRSVCDQLNDAIIAIGQAQAAREGRLLVVHEAGSPMAEAIARWRAEAEASAKPSDEFIVREF